MDIETGAIVGHHVARSRSGDTTTIKMTLPEAIEQLIAVTAVTDDVVRPSNQK